MAAQKTLNILGNQLANEYTKRKHMQNEVANLKTQIQQKEENMGTLKESLSNIKNKSMTTEDRLNELNKIYEVNNTRVRFEEREINGGGGGQRGSL